MAAGGSAGAESGYWKLGVELLILFERQMERPEAASSTSSVNAACDEPRGAHWNNGRLSCARANEGVVEKSVCEARSRVGGRRAEAPTPKMMRHI